MVRINEVLLYVCVYVFMYYIFNRTIKIEIMNRSPSKSQKNIKKYNLWRGIRNGHSWHNVIEIKGWGILRK